MNQKRKKRQKANSKPKYEPVEGMEIKPKSKKGNKVILRKETETGKPDVFRSKEQGQFDSRILSPFRMNNAPIEQKSASKGPANEDPNKFPSRVTFIPY